MVKNCVLTWHLTVFYLALRSKVKVKIQGQGQMFDT